MPALVGALEVRLIQTMAFELCYRARRLDLMDDVAQEGMLAAWQAADMDRNGQYWAVHWGVRTAIRDMTRQRLVRPDEYWHSRIDELHAEWDIEKGYAPRWFLVDEPGYAEVDAGLMRQWLLAMVDEVTANVRHRAVARDVMAGLPQVEAAARHGVSEAAVSKAMRTVRSRLRQRLLDGRTAA